MQISRQDAVDLLLENNDKLRVTNSYKNRKLERFLTKAWDQDRHVTIGEFATHEKTLESFQSSNLVFFEIDDYELKESDKNNELLNEKLIEHVKIVSNAMREFSSRVIYPSHFNWPEPILATYSGNKSFHLLYRFDRVLSKEEYCFCKEQFTHFSNVIMNAPDKYPFSRKLDFQVIFSPAHCPRFPCDIQEDNRRPQFGYVLNKNPTHEMKYINTEAFLSIVNVHKKINNIVFKEKKKSISSKIHADYPSFTKDILEDILEIKLVPTKASEDKFLITCINPEHNDSNRSAFITLTGFVYCTVCCNKGKKWISRVLSNSTIIHNKG